MTLPGTAHQGQGPRAEEAQPLASSGEALWCRLPKQALNDE